jgi:hypothetical protein
MTLALYVVGLTVIAAASVFVAAPFFRPRAAATSAGGSERERWERQKRQALVSIKEAELDHRMGKLTDDDLAGMRARFEAQALEAMAALERRGEGE